MKIQRKLREEKKYFMRSPTTYLQLQSLEEIKIAHIYDLYKTGPLKAFTEDVQLGLSDIKNAKNI